MLGGPRTDAQGRRIQAIKQYIGCVLCIMEGAFRGESRLGEWCDYHHCDDESGQNHDRGYGNCPWHHTGRPKNWLSQAAMKEQYGPSLKLHPKEYRERYGTEQEILDYQNKLYKAYEESIIGGPTL